MGLKLLLVRPPLLFVYCKLGRILPGKRPPAVLRFLTGSVILWPVSGSALVWPVLDPTVLPLVPAPVVL